MGVLVVSQGSWKASPLRPEKCRPQNRVRAGIPFLILPSPLLMSHRSRSVPLSLHSGGDVVGTKGGVASEESVGDDGCAEREQ